MATDLTVLYDDTPWTPAEMGLLAGEAFSKLDDTDYSDYLGDDDRFTSRDL